MQFVVVKQIAVEAETPEEAVAKIAEGRTIALTVSIRPQSQPTGPIVPQMGSPVQLR